jgi:hypothetical protein
MKYNRNPKKVKNHWSLVTSLLSDPEVKMSKCSLFKSCVVDLKLFFGSKSESRSDFSKGFRSRYDFKKFGSGSVSDAKFRLYLYTNDFKKFLDGLLIHTF